MTSPARRIVPATAPQTLQARSYFPAPIYGRHAPTLPPDEPVPGTVEEWEAVTAVRPDTPHVRALRFLSTAGDLLAAFVLIGGGMGLIGLATHL
ncbi:hypothetical protein SAMN02799631_05881 [Methylobacterium sp. 174MFSha1.1]|uniref:hypothetical protein n=1 Tax=Methylobacterium sp. 174MFSha1.1 TaxID=1502749 RepID=UPI0008E8776D|nr:hypothetical protein [Methylobacterium sp. 174MFSha1.1]SFV14486.1 hypothetical protein SAMN02799631_05881 [Methylobacterium sp. 174MFSha1.1]